MKKVLVHDRYGISKEVKEYKGSGFFKYYELEQYVFFGDDKLAHAVKLMKNGKLNIALSQLYPDIDIAESLSDVLGKDIRKRTADSATFKDGTTEKIDPEKMTEEEKMHFISLIKPYLWWGE